MKMLTKQERVGTSDVYGRAKLSDLSSREKTG